MSYDITLRSFSRRAAAAAEVAATDRQHVEFLARLIASETVLTDWEEDFATKILYRAVERESGTPVLLSDRERKICGNLKDKYGDPE